MKCLSERQTKYLASLSFFSIILCYSFALYINTYDLFTNVIISPEDDWFNINYSKIVTKSAVLDRLIKKRFKSKINLKNILIFNPHITPFVLIQYKQESFTKNNCKHTNCYMTFNRSYMRDVRDFDAIIFTGCSIRKLNVTELPKKRSVKQKYVYANIEPSTIFPVTDPIYDNYFNWTWTHRLDSDVLWRYFTVSDLNNTIIGPAINMNWPKQMKPIDVQMKIKLRSKTKAAAWFVSHCKTNGHRENFVEMFNEEFERYGWTVDVYGECGNKSCTKYSQRCFEMLKKDYYFYLSFENSVDEDYVTEKILTALNNFVVPVVYGGANYSRFLPPGSYLNARELGPRKLAKVMSDAIKNSSIYYDFFRWSNHFQYKVSDATTELCNICTALNDKTRVKTTTVYKDFRIWWNGGVRQRTYEIMLKNFLINKSLRNFVSNYNYTRQNSLVLMEFVRNQTNIV